jgi:hypothetical protein
MDSVPLKDTLKGGVDGARSVAPIILTVFLFTFGIGYMMSKFERKHIMDNWEERRCEVPVMFSGWLYKPPEDPRTAGQFAQDNMAFCMKSIQDSVLDKAMEPAREIMKGQEQAAETLASSQLSSKATMMRTLNDVVGKVLVDFFTRLRIMGDQIKVLTGRLKMGFERVQAMLVSSVLAGISMVQGVMNFYNTVVLVVIIILAIIAAIFIILFIVLWPFAPLLISVTSLLVAAGFGASAGGFAAVFCFSPETPVRLVDGSTKRMDTLQLGDVLEGGGVVEGMYEMRGTDSELYQLGEAVVSGDHLVWDAAASTWVYVRDHLGALKVGRRCERVYCPSVSNRCIPVGDVWFRDWEEIPEESEDAWEAMVWRMLTGSEAPPDMRHTGEANGFSGRSVVFVKGRGATPIEEVKIGDEVLGRTFETTRVLGVVRIRAPECVAKTERWMAGGCWIYEPKHKTWHHPAKREHTGKIVVVHSLITTSGEFYISTDDGNRLIRDAFEVGLNGMERTYEFTLTQLRNTDSQPPIRR